MGEGTSVTLYLPRTRSTALAKSQVVSGQAEAIVPADATILLVDDDTEVREITATVVTDLGYRVIEAPTGGVALEILHSGKTIDLMLVDFAMPGMNGVELAQRVRATRPEMPVLFATGYADVTGLASGLTGEMVVGKPYRRNELGAKIRLALGQRSRFNILPLRPPALKT